MKWQPGLVKDTVETLFGLNLVSQLQKDLDVYLTRQSIDGDARQIQYQLKALNEKQETLQQQLTDLKSRKHANQMEMERLTEQMNGQKQKIASEGGWFAEQLDETEDQASAVDG